MTLPAPREAAEEQIVYTYVTVTLVTKVALVDCPGLDRHAAAIECVAEELSSFCADFGWEQAELVAVPVTASATVTP